ncbi:hypothetical protein I3842_06G098600 [Carya illinoinensis]|uniref:non-specific serine/threonine protein kinase n=1 Tax=Carya illinoinensis TaxID=32201 RepID=A0A922EWB5_CARIL|nr:hypothetical protein I3842_06G098600 [Carya illinoinensis]
MASRATSPESSPSTTVPPSSNTVSPSTTSSSPQPSSSTTPPAQTSSPPAPAPPTISTPSGADPPDPATTSTSSPLTQSPPPVPESTSPPSPSGTSPPLTPTISSPPPLQSDPPTSPSPPSSNVPPLPSKSPPPESSRPPPSRSDPPVNPPPPPPSSTPPAKSPPPPSSTPPVYSPPPPASVPRPSSPPTPASTPPVNSPPPAASVPPQSSPPTPASTTPVDSPPTPALVPPQSSPPPPEVAPVPPGSEPTPPPSNSPPKLSPPSPIIHLAPPPPSHVSPPSPYQNPIPPSNDPAKNNSNSNEVSNSTSNGTIGITVIVAIGVVVGIIVLSLIGVAVWCMRKQRKRDSGVNGHVMRSTPDISITKTHSSAPLLQSGSGSNFVSTPAEPSGLGNSKLWFSYEELVKATNGFSNENLLGEGGFGSVYKGYLPDGKEVAVKQLNIGGGQGEREFKAEFEIIGRIHHRHLVSLVGYCISENRRLLVYDYVPNNTLYFHLHGEGRPALDWATRVKVAAGAARGIAYLHEDCHPRIIHRDIKSSNILLDNNFEARVSDFGLAKLALDADTHITTRVMGTFGYMAPEYASSGKLTDKSDVYSFGVVLLELITGRKPVDASQPLGDESLVEWARPLLNHALDDVEFKHLADPRLMNYVGSEMFRMIEVAAACVRHSAAKRPRMGLVVRAFDSLATSDLTNGMRVGESAAFDSAQQSEEIRLFRRMAFGSQNYSTDFFSQSNLYS